MAGCLLMMARAAMADQAASAVEAATLNAQELREPVTLSGTWLIHAGDDPSYARPELDDSAWTRFDPRNSLHSVFSTRPAVVWYRMRVKTDPRQQGLALEEQNLSRAFEIYVDGQRVLAVGSIAPYRPGNFQARLLAPFPEAHGGDGVRVIALRVSVSASEWMGTNPGLFFTNLRIGQASTLREHILLTIVSQNAFGWAILAMSFAVGLVALVLFLTQREQREYLWIVLLIVSVMIEAPVIEVRLFSDLDPIWYLLDGVALFLRAYSLAMVFYALMGEAPSRRMHVFVMVASLLAAIATVGLGWGLLTTGMLIALGFPYNSFTAAILPALLIRNWRRGNREAGILLIPAIFNSFTLYAGLAVVLGSTVSFLRSRALQAGQTLGSGFVVGPFSLGTYDIANLLMILSLAVIMLRRFSQVSRLRVRYESDLEAAREIQQLLVPEKTEITPGYKVESAYLPAQQVGGDFFQVFATAESGMLVVIGDVAGKGVPAAMLVSVIVGSLRTAAEETHDPAVLLRRLNERLVGRSRGGFSTALAAHFHADGRVMVANAGHLPPYLDGAEVALPGGLPLGITGGVEYALNEIRLGAGSRLTFYSDGVIEAQNARGEMLGFARGEGISRKPAAEIAEVARSFGQTDDITVVAVERA